MSNPTPTERVEALKEPVFKLLESWNKDERPFTRNNLIELAATLARFVEGTRQLAAKLEQAQREVSNREDDLGQLVLRNEELELKLEQANKLLDAVETLAKADSSVLNKLAGMFVDGKDWITALKETKK
jgi:ABC-type transporter Mla subunit MlaD